MATRQLAEGKATRGEGRAIGPIGTTARVATGLWLFSSIGWAAARGDLQIHEVLLGLVGLPIIVMLVVVASQRVLGTSAYLRATGPVGTMTNLSMIVALFATPWTTEISPRQRTPCLSLSLEGEVSALQTRIARLLQRRIRQRQCV